VTGYGVHDVHNLIVRWLWTVPTSLSPSRVRQETVVVVRKHTGFSPLSARTPCLSRAPRLRGREKCLFAFPLAFSYQPRLLNPRGDLSSSFRLDEVSSARQPASVHGKDSPYIVIAEEQGNIAAPAISPAHPTRAGILSSIWRLRTGSFECSGIVVPYIPGHRVHVDPFGSPFIASAFVNCATPPSPPRMLEQNSALKEEKGTIFNILLPCSFSMCRAASCDSGTPPSDSRQSVHSRIPRGIPRQEPPNRSRVVHQDVDGAKF